MEPLWYVLDGKTPRPAKDMMEGAAALENTKGRIVGKTKVGDYEVSTVFLGLDHRFSGDGPPILFESMIFGPDDSQSDDQRRYCTWDEAEEGHEALVSALAKRLGHLIEDGTGSDAEQLLEGKETE